MTLDDLYSELVDGFSKRKFSAGLLIAFIDFYDALGVPGSGFQTLDDVLVRFPRRTSTAAGQRANTLIVEMPDGTTQSLRPFYNAVERLFRADHKRFDYPSCAPHATQAWADYVRWLDALTKFRASDLRSLRARIVEYVLDTLANQEFDPASVAIDPPLFRLLLESFEMTAHSGEPTGASFQGMVFGFLRADNPHLQIEISKVRTGSKRLQRVGDVDGWEGARLAVSAEVKQYVLAENDVVDLEAFGNEAGRRGAVGLLIALGFADGAREAVEALGLKARDIADLRHIVELWDPLKQRIATTSFVYYARHVEKNAALTARIDRFLRDATDAHFLSRTMIVPSVPAM